MIAQLKAVSLLIALAIYVFGTPLVSGARADDFELCGRHYAEISALEGMIAKEFAAEPVASAKYVAYFDRPAFIMWTFTHKGQIPYPAVVCRKFVQSGMAWSVHMTANCFGTTAQCDGMISEFKKLDDGIIVSVTSKSNNSTRP